MKTFNDHCNCGRESSLVESNVYRVGSEKYFEYWRNIRKEYYAGNVMIESHEVDIMESDLGEFGTFNGENVALDCIFEDDKQDAPLNQPKRGGRRSTMCMSKTHQQVMLRKYLGVTLVV